MNKRYLYEYNAVNFLESHVCNAYFKSIKHENYESVCLIKYIIIIASHNFEIYRSSCSMVFFENSVQKNFVKFTGKTPKWSPYKLKIQAHIIEHLRTNASGYMKNQLINVYFRAGRSQHQQKHTFSSFLSSSSSVKLPKNESFSQCICKLVLQAY